MRRYFALSLVVTLFVPALTWAQNQREFCTGVGCAAEGFEVRFGMTQEDAVAKQYVKQVTAADVDQEFDALVVADVTTENIQGWSMGLQHDTAVLEILSVTVQGLRLAAGDIFFETTALAVPANDGDPNPGFVSAMVLAIFPAPGVTLPMETDVRMVTAKYKLVSVPAGDSKLEFVNTLIPAPGSPPTATNLTISQQTNRPSFVIDGVVRGGEPPMNCFGDGPEPPAYAYYFGSAVTSNSHAIAAADTSVMISMRNALPSLGFSGGVHIADDGTFTFEDETVGTDNERLIEMIVTDNAGGSQKPDKGNTATSAKADNSITSIEKGPALTDAAFEASFLAVELSPGAGGPGFTFGFVADTTGTAAEIPATEDPMAPPCAVSEVLVVNFGIRVGEPFNRGDCDGNGKHNISDGAICAQRIFLNRLNNFPNCDEIYDANDDGELNGLDPIAILTWVFLNGAALPAPFKSCVLPQGVECLAPSNCTP